jgi:nuclear cap-binding protein subunit 1
LWGDRNRTPANRTAFWQTIGTELVKIILLTIPYILAAAPGESEQKAATLMDKTEVIAGEPHVMQALIDPYVPEEDEENPSPSMSIIGLLQKQLQVEAADGWKLACLPRPWKMPLEEVEAAERIENAPKHTLPSINVPQTVVAGPRSLFPEVFFSVFTNQEIESTPPVTNIAAFLIRDGLMDTINILDFNRNVTAKFLIDIDCYFAEGTFVKRATPFDRLKDVEPGKSTWKPEDVAVDTVFSQIFQLPAAEHKVVYYHSVLTEACKLAPAAIAPSLGRAIRFLYRATPRMDLELSHRFIDWFSHHLSNFGFTWKWTEWEEDVFLSSLHPRKAFVLGAIDKEIRLSFSRRIKGTLPPAYQDLIIPDMEKDAPDFKYNDPSTPFAAEGKEIEGLLRRKAPDEDFQPVIEKIHNAALDLALDPLVASTDVFMTTVCAVGAKSLSHILTYIDRTKGRLIEVGGASEAARAQIISSVMAYWRNHPGVALSIVEKLLNYGILTPLSVVEWVLLAGPSSSAAGRDGRRLGESLAGAHMFEMVVHTIAKVTGRVRQVALASADELDYAPEAKAMRDLFRTMDEALIGWADGSKDLDGDVEDDAMDAEKVLLVRRWAGRWMRVFRRKAAFQDAFLAEVAKNRAAEAS